MAFHKIKLCLFGAVFVAAMFLPDHAVEAKPLLPGVASSENGDILNTFFHTVQLLIEHALKSRDLNINVAEFYPSARVNSKSARFRRQLNLGQTLANLALLNGGNQGSGPSGIGFVENVAQAMSDFDRLRCVNRMLCETMATRGSEIRNRTRNGTNKNNKQGSYSLNNLLAFVDPSTFRSVLGVLQFFRVNQLSSYPYIEAALWGTQHGSTDRCKSLFSQCPSTSEAFIEQLNNTPGGLQGVLTRIASTLRPQGTPTEAASVQTASQGLTNQVDSEIPDDIDTSGFYDAFGNFIPFDTDTEDNSAASSVSSGSFVQDPSSSFSQQQGQFAQTNFNQANQQFGHTQFNPANQQFTFNPQAQLTSFPAANHQQFVTNNQFQQFQQFQQHSNPQFVSKREFGQTQNAGWRWS